MEGLKSYVCYRAKGPLKLDGRVDKAEWKDIPWTDEFVDIEGDKKPKPRYRTRAKMMWDDQYLYIAAEMEEPHVWATLTEHDSVIFHDNDFEVFLDPDGDNHMYAELEINALNTTWDLLLPKPYRDGGPAINAFELHGLKTAVHVDGTLNDPRDRDRGWSTEIAIPWKVLSEIARCPSPPADGDQWRINFSRVQWETEVRDGKYVKLPGKPEDNWVWSPQGVIDMHRPEMWGVLQFSTKPVGTDRARPLDGLREREELMRVYWAQREFHGKHGRYASSAAELGLVVEGLSLSVTPSLFEAVVGRWHLDQSSRIWKS